MPRGWPRDAFLSTPWADGARGQPHCQVLCLGGRQARPPHPVFRRLIFFFFFKSICKSSHSLLVNSISSGLGSSFCLSIILHAAYVSQRRSSFPGHPGATCEFNSLPFLSPSKTSICHQDGAEDDTRGTRDLRGRFT